MPSSGLAPPGPVAGLPSSVNPTHPTPAMHLTPVPAGPTAKPFRRSPALAWIALTALTALGAEAAVITGSVMNQNTKRFLERATVQVQGTSFSTLTDKDGSFRLAGLPAGTHTVTVSYTELDSVSQSITVTAEETARLSFELTSEKIYQLGEFVVTSSVEGMAYAVNQQRRALSARSVTSIDAFLDQATGNPGEFLKSVEGIQMDYSQNEPQAIRIRGFDPTLTMVTMDGNEIASAASSSANRTVQIDQLSIASIENVEVYKAPIPSMSANAIGGAVNFNTRSAFDQKGRRASLQLGVNMDSNDFGFHRSPGPGHGEKAERRIYPAGRLRYSNSFFDNRLGIDFSVGHDYTNQLGSSTSHALNVTALPGGALPAAPIPYTEDNVTVRRGTLSYAPNRQLRVRSDVSLNTDFKVSDSLAVFLKTTFTDYLSTNRNHSLNLTPGTLVAGATVTDYTTTNGTAGQGISVFDKKTKSWQINPGLKWRRDEWKIDLVGGFSKSTNHYTNPDTFTGLSTTLTGVGFSVSTPRDTDVPTAVTQTSGPDFYNLNNYAPSQGNLASTNGQHRANHNGLVSNNHRDSRDMKYSARFDVQRDFTLRFPFFVKAGLAYNETIFDKRQEQKRWYWMGLDGLATADDVTAAGAQLGRFAEPVPVTQNIPGWTLREPTYFSTNELYKFWQANPQVLQENTAYTAQQKIAGRQKVNEQVRAGYVMANATLRKLNILTGLRLEQTDIRAEGYRVLPTALPAGVDANSLPAILLRYRPMVTRSDYRSDPFKYLHLKYDWTSRLQSRASFTDAIGRPNLSDVLPNNVSENPTTEIISTNRAGLLPQRSKNLDFSLEYYTKSSGQWTAGWFRRDVDDYISSATVPMTPELLAELNLGSEYNNWQVATKTNLGNATWSGFELSFRQSLREFSFVPAALTGVSVWANYTRISKMEGDFGTPGARITELANVVPELVNAGISYRSPRSRIVVQLTTNYQAKRPTQNLPANAAAGQRRPYQEPYQFYNLEASYQATQNLRLMCTARNLFSERPTFTEIGIVRNTQQATGIAWLFAVKYDL
ncbi:MAG TPA: TonB-dependent receptor [Opitutaceae bacterium]|nr:TonB-dependent receptor [Opitutaceae bacterium]HRE06110.1 TonB-dependent receptor [Opitutaceae bacterium]